MLILHLSLLTRWAGREGWAHIWYEVAVVYTVIYVKREACPRV